MFFIVMVVYYVFYCDKFLKHIYTLIRKFQEFSRFFQILFYFSTAKYIFMEITKVSSKVQKFNKITLRLLRSSTIQLRLPCHCQASELTVDRPPICRPPMHRSALSAHSWKLHCFTSSKCANSIATNVECIHASVGCIL